MDRKFSVRYKKAGGDREHNESDKRSMNTFERDTDTNILALGDAAHGADIDMSELDDIFQNFGISLSEAFGGHQEVISDTSSVQPPPTYSNSGQATLPTNSAEGATVRKISGQNDQDVQVSTITKTLPDGKTVQTRVFRGPVQTRKRIMRISRELPNGETQLLGTFEGDQNIDISQALQTVLTEPSQNGSGNNTSQPVSNADASSDVNTHNSLDPNQSNDIPFVDASPHCNRKMLPKLPPLREFRPSPVSLNCAGPSPAEPHSPRVVTFQEPAPVLDDGEVPSSPPPCSPLTMRSSSMQSDSSSQGTRKSFATDEAIMMFNPDEIVQDMEFEEEPRPVCPCCPKLWIRKAHRIHRSGSDQFRGRLGMTQSEINTNEQALPGLQALVANYAKMLYEDKSAFIQTFFRAVKLNKLDVVKILCKIVHKTGFKLSSRELREPESSATILHVALLYNHKAIIEYLINKKESDLIMTKYENVQYQNQTTLHVAVANGDLGVVEKLLMALEGSEQTVLINTIANGKYFQTQHPHGQLCLTAAAWAGNGEIIKALVQHGGNLVLKNSKGNTLMHSIVLQSSQYPSRNDYEGLLMAVWEATGIWAEQMVYNSRSAEQRDLEQSQMQIDLFKELLSIRNNDGYTPLALSSTMGSKLFHFLVNFEKIYKIPQNKLGSITWVTYDVTDITSFAYNNYNKFSILHILAHKSQQLSRHANLSQEDVEDYLEMEPVNALHACKWQVYRVMYIIWLFLHLSYMIVFTACTVETNSSPFTYHDNTSMADTDPERALINDDMQGHSDDVQYGFVAFIVLPIVYIILEVLDLLGNTPYRIQFMSAHNYIARALKCMQSEWTITGNGPYRLVSVAFSYFQIEWFILYVIRDENQDVSLAMALLLGWVFVLFFTRGCRVTCRFTIMIQKMFFRDLIYFLTVYGIILIAFSFAMNAMFTYVHDADFTISNVFYEMLNVVTDLDKKQNIDNARHLRFARILLIIYAIVAVILLMNMLIAMMNTSYETIRVTRVNLWRQQQLSIMLMMERRFFWWKWLCRKSEGDVWRKEDDDDMRCYLDVTVLHTPGYTVN